MGKIQGKVVAGRMELARQELMSRQCLRITQAGLRRKVLEISLTR
jgi:hypothetical protein